MNINKSIIKFCSACGSKLEAPVKSGKPVKCEKCPKTSYLDPKVAVGGVIINSSKQLLLVKRNIEPNIGKWSFPSGFVDSGEIIEEALKRETLEETGIKISVGQLIGTYSTKNEQIVFIAYLANTKSEEITINQEIQDADFFDFENLPHLAFAHDDEIIQKTKKILDGKAEHEPSKEIFNISLLQKRGIEAEVLIPLIRNLEKEIGKELAHQLARNAIKEIAEKQGKDFSSMIKRDDLDGFQSIQETWSGAGTDIIYEILESNKNEFNFNVTKCRFAEMYKQLGAEDLGYILSCGRDFSLSSGYSENIHLDRTKTIMEGASFCDFRYRKN
tara:strand:- start:531 stop:1520 length:990 start_codon:yes stop_codon:yes gene_type:complete